MIEEVLKPKRAILFKFGLKNNLVDSFIYNMEKNHVVIKSERMFYNIYVLSLATYFHIEFYSNIKISCHSL